MLRTSERNRFAHCVLLGIMLANSLPDELPAQNFRCRDAQIVRVAEAARENSAQFWSGSPLPGNWFSPCPITIDPYGSCGRGRTQFVFDQGEVTHWRMSVSGTQEAILEDVIPHEVDHMVRASLVRHPVERWLDEGCAALMESPESHRRLRIEAARADAAIITPEWLSARHYPAHPTQTSQLYAVGFSLVEFLLTRGSPRDLLHLQSQQGFMARRIEVQYGLTLDELRNEWSSWHATRMQLNASCNGGCAIHDIQPASSQETVDGTRPTLTIWTAAWCGPCQAFWRDVQSNDSFHSWLHSHFQVRSLDYDRHRDLALQKGITTLPTFEIEGQFVSGYQSQTLLMRTLLTMISDKTPKAIDRPSVPDDVAETSESPIETTDVLPPMEEPQGVTGHPENPSSDNPATSPNDIAVDASSGHPSSSFDMSVSREWLASLLDVLQGSGVLGGTLATGGLGGAAVWGVSLLWKKLRSRRAHSNGSESPTHVTRRGTMERAPFPRQLDEARELLELRESEGRVAALDAIRGMFLDDELDKLAQSSSSDVRQLVSTLRSAIDHRVAEVAPLSVDAE